MTLRLRYEYLSESYPKQMGSEVSRLARAATKTMQDVADGIKTEGRAQLAAARMSSRFQNSMYAKAYPQQGASLHPSVVAGLKPQYASVFEQGATISGKPLLWLPLDTAPAGRGGARITPDEFVKTVGVLYSINHPGKPPLLAAVVRESDARARNLPSLSLLKRGRNPGGRGSVRLVPMFVGVPDVTDPQKYNITAVIERWADQIDGIFDRNFNETF